MKGIFTVILFSVIFSFFGQEQAFSASDNNSAANGKGSNLYFNPLDFGALANDGRDDSFAFQQIINTPTGNQTLVITVPEGTFDFFSQIDLKSNLIIEGENRENTFILWHTEGKKDKNIFYGLGQVDSPLKNITFKNIAIKGTGVETMGDCIHLISVSNYTIRDTTLSDCGSGSRGAAIFGRNTSDGIIVYNKIYNTRNGYLNPFGFDGKTQTIGGSTNILIGYNLIVNSTKDGIHAANGTYNTIIGNFVIDSGDDNIDISNEKNMKITNNTIFMTTNSTNVNGFEIGDGSENIELFGNKVMGGVKYGINISSKTTDFDIKLNKNITISENEISKTTAGCVRLRFAEDITIQNNYFEQCTQDNDRSEANGIRIKEGVKNVLVKNNTIQFDSGKGRSGILISGASNIEVISNTIQASERNLEKCKPISIKKETDNLKIFDNYFQPCECLVQHGFIGENSQTSDKFSASSELEENIYQISGETKNNRVSSFEIIPETSVMIDLECPTPGAIEIMFPKSLIDGIHTISAESENSSKKIPFEQISDSSNSATIKLNFPSNTKSLEVQGSTVIPEFSIFASLILVLSFSMILIFRKPLRNLTEFS